MRQTVPEIGRGPKIDGREVQGLLIFSLLLWSISYDHYYQTHCDSVLIIITDIETSRMTQVADTIIEKYVVE